MKIRINVSTNFVKDKEIYEVIADLEKHLGKQIPHDRMTNRGFFVGKGWAIDHCAYHWCVRMDARTARKPWAVAFRMKWS